MPVRGLHEVLLAQSLYLISELPLPFQGLAAKPAARAFSPHAILRYGHMLDHRGAINDVEILVCKV